jgi:hypothetical protein
MLTDADKFKPIWFSSLVDQLTLLII